MGTRRRALLLLAGGALLLLLGAPALRHPLDALLLVQALRAGEEASWLARWRPAPARSEAGEAGAPVDLYRGGDPPRGCVLLAHGMTDLGRRDPRLAALARALARLGFAAAVPELPGMRRFRPDPADAARIARAFGRLDRARPPGAARCALIAFSFAAGPALRAAARPALRDRVGAFVGVGAYYDLRAVLRHLTTGGGGDVPAFPGGPPVRGGKWLFLRMNPDLLGWGDRRGVAEALARRKLADERADVSDLAGRLPPEARALLALLENEDPARFGALYRAQPAALRERLEALSMAEVVPRTRAPLFLLHGAGDPFVPPSESARLAARARARPGGAGPVRLLVAEALGHVDPARGGSRLRAGLEALRLVGFVSAALAAMEGAR